MSTMHLIHAGPLLFEPGDRFSRDEFLERWERMPSLKFAELIEGVVYMPSPVSNAHSAYDSQSHLLINYYAARTPGCVARDNATWLMLESAPQPDAALFVAPEYGGRVGKEKVLLKGASELVVEGSLSSHSYDLGSKLALYQRAEVLEYITALVEERRIEWRVLDSGQYRLIRSDSHGIFRSTAFPGLWLDSAAYWGEDSGALLAVLDKGLSSPEHARFVEELAAKRT